MFAFVLVKICTNTNIITPPYLRFVPLFSSEWPKNVFISPFRWKQHRACKFLPKKKLLLTFYLNIVQISKKSKPNLSQHQINSDVDTFGFTYLKHCVNISILVCVQNYLKIILNIYKNNPSSICLNKIQFVLN